MENSKKLKILFVSAEVSPFAKTGGLADVAGSLPQALAARGNDVRVVMPGYGCIDSPMDYTADFPVMMRSHKETCIIRETMLDNEAEGGGRVTVYFTDSYHYFDRDGIYCYHDDADRFIFFCKAVLQMLPAINFQPDVIHCNDWHTGPVCMLLEEKYRKESFYSDISTVFTVHNLEYQGNFPGEVFELLEVPKEAFTSEKTEFYGMFSFMKAGLVYSDIINTVSETYAKEIRTPEFGEKLEGLLIKRSEDLYGIVNGISCHTFNPSEDKRIYINYDVDNHELKKENKKALQKEMGLPLSDAPLIGLVSRLTGQKGLDLILECLEDMLRLHVQFILLGSGDPYFENAFREAAEKYPGKMAVHTGFNAALAQKIYAGSDLFLMPSRFEPCGLGQIISLRYGTIPIVRATGGLADTITDISVDGIKGNGFSFTGYSPGLLFETIKRAVTYYADNNDRWNALVRRALTLDFSWRKPAERYLELYKKAAEKRKLQV